MINSASRGIEHALWDINGKALGVPVYRLLGGKFRDKIRVYQSSRGDTPEALAENALSLIERYGYTALKLERIQSSQAVGAAARVEALRRAVGDDIDIGVDAHARVFEPVRALQMAERSRPYEPYFFEEPLRPENIDALADLRARYDPIATGEMLYTKYEFRDLLERRGRHSASRHLLAGGLLELKKIAAMAEAFYVTVAPHNPVAMATAVNVHLAPCTPNFLILEYSPDDVGKRRDLLLEPLKVTNGYIDVPQAPFDRIEPGGDRDVHAEPLALSVPDQHGRLARVPGSLHDLGISRRYPRSGRHGDRLHRFV